MSTIMEMAEVHAVRIAERDATIASQAAEIEAYKHEAEVYREIKIEYEILLARSQREAAQIERLEHAINRLLAWCESEAGNGSNLSDEQVEDELESIELARAALQPKDGE